MAGKKREKEFARWPKYKDMYISAFDRMLEERKRRGKMRDSSPMWNTGLDVFNWWMQYDVIPGQMNFDELTSEEDADESTI